MTTVQDKNKAIDPFEYWLRSKEADKVMDESILLFPTKNREYLKNRLWAAFQAGRKYEFDLQQTTKP